MTSTAKKLVNSSPAPNVVAPRKPIAVPAKRAAKPVLTVVTSSKSEATQTLLQADALKGCPIPVFLCDKSWDIVFANDAAIESLQEMEEGLASANDDWSSFRADYVVGSNLTFFFSDDPFGFKKVSDPRNHPLKKNLCAGPFTCELDVETLRDHKGEIRGFAVYWSNVSERLKQENSYKAEINTISERIQFLSQACATDLATAMDSLAGGNLDFVIEPRTPLLEIPKQPELALMAESFNGLRNQTVKSVEAYLRARTILSELTSEVGAGAADLARAMKALAAGDLTCEISSRNVSQATGGHSTGVFGELLLQTSSSIEAYLVAKESLAGLIAKALVAADTIVDGSAEVMNGNDDLAQRTEEQAASLEETASSMEEMTSTVKQNADNARQADRLAVQARETAEKGGLVVGQAVTTMEEINSASKRIADIISVIDEIAFQTNLLALNAAVEAARVGEQGRGFAVVAAEVRNLAGRSATAAKEIKGLVQDSVQKVQEGRSLVNQSGTQLGEIVTSVKKVADIISEIAAAALEQSAGIEQVNKAITQMDQITQQNAALVEEASAASQSMNRQATDLQSLVGQFQVDADFLAQTQDKLQAEQVMSASAAAKKAHQMNSSNRNERVAPRSSSRTIDRLTKARRPSAECEEFEEF